MQYTDDALQKVKVADLKKILIGEGFKASNLKKQALISKIKSHCTRWSTTNIRYTEKEYLNQIQSNTIITRITSMLWI
jgi:hypothetical protein